MTSLTISYNGPPEQKHTVKVSPMATLSSVLAEVCPKLKPALEPGAAELRLNKKAVDLGTPFRLLNIPAGSKLELARGAPRPQAAMPAAGAGTAAAPSTAPPVTHSEAPSSSTAGSSHTGGRTLAAVSTGSQEPDPGASTSSDNASLKSIGITRQLQVFNRQAVEAAGGDAAGPSSGGPENEPPDEFFEFTPDDFAALQRAANAKRKAEDRFVTRAAREANEAARAQGFGPVPVRLQLPDNSIVQAEFKATDPLAHVQEFAQQCVQPGLAPGLYLYTAPPKTVLSNLEASLHAARLVPAAHIYIGFDPKKVEAGASTSDGPCLRPEVSALMSDAVPQQQPRASAMEQEGAGNGGAAAAAGSSDQRTAAGGAGRIANIGGGSAAGGKVPKWFKVGGK